MIKDFYIKLRMWLSFSLMLIIMPALGHINIPTDPDKRASLLGLQDKSYVAKQLINFMLDVLLLPYG